MYGKLLCAGFRAADIRRGTSTLHSVGKSKRTRSQKHNSNKKHSAASNKFPPGRNHKKQRTIHRVNQHKRQSHTLPSHLPRSQPSSHSSLFLSPYFPRPPVYLSLGPGPGFAGHPACQCQAGWRSATRTPLSHSKCLPLTEHSAIPW